MHSRFHTALILCTKESLRKVNVNNTVTQAAETLAEDGKALCTYVDSIRQLLLAPNHSA